MALSIDPGAERSQAVVHLFEQLMDVYSVSGSETELADEVEEFLRAIGYGTAMPCAGPVTAGKTSDCSVHRNDDIDAAGAVSAAGATACDSCTHGTLALHRLGDTVVASTNFGLPQRVVLAGHLDTVPVIDNFPPVWLEPGSSRIREDVASASPNSRVMWGRGATDMKASDAVFLYIAYAAAKVTHESMHDCAKRTAAVTEDTTLSGPFRYDLTFVFYDHEEVQADLNGLRKVAEAHPDWLKGDFAIIGEPTNCGIEGGCNGTMRFDVVTHGVAAHSARAWMGHNAIHDAAAVLDKLASYEPADVEVDGLTYREGLNATMISGGNGTNIVPDECRVHVNYRFAPDKTVEQAKALMFGEGSERQGNEATVPRLGGGEQVACGGLFQGFAIEMKDESPSARPGMDSPLVSSLATLVESRTKLKAQAKLGWTDVARFSQLGVPAVNLGAGSPLLAHKADEQLPVSQLDMLCDVIFEWLSS